MNGTICNFQIFFLHLQNFDFISFGVNCLIDQHLRQSYSGEFSYSGHLHIKPNCPE